MYGIFSNYTSEEKVFMATRFCCGINLQKFRDLFTVVFNTRSIPPASSVQKYAQDIERQKNVLIGSVNRGGE